jgi:PKD repeat protein
LVLRAPLVAKAAVSPLFPGTNGPVYSVPLMTFLNASAVGGTPPYAYAWDFGDGATSSVQNATHTYALPGTYAAVLTVTDSGGGTATSTAEAGASSADGVHWVMGAADPTLGSAPLRVHFSVTGTGELPASYGWAFGDGASANSSETNHTYARAGTYIARLNVRESGGANDTYRLTVVVSSGAPLVTLASATVLGLCNSDVWNRVNFQGQVGGGTPPYAFSWQFGEKNATSLLQSPSYSYSAPAWPQLANLTVTDAQGHVATSTVSSRVLPPSCPPQNLLPWWVIVVGGTALAAAAVLAVVLTRRRTSSPPQPPSPPTPPR